MNGEYLLDTNIVVALFNGEPEVRAKLDTVAEVYLPVVVLGELQYGAVCSSHPDSNLARVDGFASSCTVLGVDEDTAREYGKIKGELRRKGRPIPRPLRRPAGGRCPPSARKSRREFAPGSDPQDGAWTFESFRLGPSW